MPLAGKLALTYQSCRGDTHVEMFLRHLGGMPQAGKFALQALILLSVKATSEEIQTLSSYNRRVYVQEMDR